MCLATFNFSEETRTGYVQVDQGIFSMFSEEFKIGLTTT